MKRKNRTYITGDDVEKKVANFLMGYCRKT